MAGPIFGSSMHVMCGGLGGERAGHGRVGGLDCGPRVWVLQFCANPLISR
jgi:hypothetical protein